MATGPRTILITGANRGLGLGLVKHLLASSQRPQHVIATSRSLGGETSKELEELALKEPSLTAIELDVTDLSSIKAAATSVESIVKEHGLNVLVNNAGIHIRQSVKDVTVEGMEQSFRANSIGPLLVTKSFLSLLQQGASQAADKPLGWQRAAIINMSTILGSISQNKGGGLYPYRCSKAALNAVTKSLSVDLIGDGIITCSVHPGWVATDMGSAKAPLGVDESVQGLLKVFAQLDEKSNGGFFQYDGSVLEW